MLMAGKTEMKLPQIFSIAQSPGVRIMLACVMALLFRTVLDLLYANFVAQYYADDSLGFPLFADNPIRLIESYAIAIVLAISTATSLSHRSRPSGIVLALYLIVVMLPLTSLYGIAGAPAAFVYAAAACFLVLIAATEILPRVRLPSPSRHMVHLALIAVAGISIYVYGWLALTGGLERLNFDLLSVYGVRALYAQTRGPMIGYFVPWQANVFNVLVMCYGMKKRNYRLAALAVIAQLFLFGMTGHKSFLLATFLAIGVFYLWQRKNAISYMLLGASLLALSSYAYFLMTDDKFIAALFIRRLFFVQAGLHAMYYDFFSCPDHPFYMLSDSILRNFYPNPYGDHMPSVIASTYWGVDFNPNVGYLGDAYGNFGFFGMVFFSAILGMVLRTIDSIGSSIPPHFVAAAISMPAISLTQSALTTVMLTHGLIPAVLMLWIFNNLMEKRGHQNNSFRCNCSDNYVSEGLRK
jgi:oligosaccharide repeat unit polymerase